MTTVASGSKEELHPNLNTILINDVGGIRRLAIISGQIEIAPGEIQLGGIANGIAHANLGIAGHVDIAIGAEATEFAPGVQAQPGCYEHLALQTEQGLGDGFSEAEVAGPQSQGTLEDVGGFDAHMHSTPPKWNPWLVVF